MYVSRRFLRPLQNWRPSVCRMPTKTLCWPGCPPVTTPSGPPSHVSSSDTWVNLSLIFSVFVCWFVSHKQWLCCVLEHKTRPFKLGAFFSGCEGNRCGLLSCATLPLKIKKYKHTQIYFIKCTVHILTVYNAPLLSCFVIFRVQRSMVGLHNRPTCLFLVNLDDRIHRLITSSDFTVESSTFFYWLLDKWFLE